MLSKLILRHILIFVIVVVSSIETIMTWIQAGKSNIAGLLPSLQRELLRDNRCIPQDVSSIGTIFKQMDLIQKFRGNHRSATSQSGEAPGSETEPVEGGATRKDNQERDKQNTNVKDTFTSNNDIASTSGQKNPVEKRPQTKRKSQLSKSLQSAQERLAELMTPGKDTLLLHEGAKYDLLGKAEDAPKVVAGASARAQEISPRRIHPHRLFYPGATYSPEELNPYKAKDVVMRSDLTVRRGTIPTQVVQDQADFRNVEFLQYFMKDTGKLFPRRKTRLPAKVHRALMREIKISRVLALSNPLKKL